LNNKSLKNRKDSHRKSELNEVEHLLEEVKTIADIRERIDQISRHFIGRPYFSNPLGGGPGEKESFSSSLEGFDCVTYIEAALALALSKNEEEFTSTLRMIRYANGKVEWSRRNHYMVDWIKENEARGFIIDITHGSGAVEKTRLLNVVSGLPAKTAVFFCYPKRIWKSVADKIETGDIVIFASVKKHLDVFHTGFLIRRNGEILLRHATRKLGAVVDQKIEEFLADHRMSGLILVRPKERKPKRKR
jgi:hypothetical protein